MFEGDPGHLREILVQEARKILRLQIFGNLREILNITEEDGELFTLGFERDILTTGKNGLIDLWREILGELQRKGFEHGVLFVHQCFLLVEFAEEVPMQRVEAVLRLLQADTTFLGSCEFPLQHAHVAGSDARLSPVELSSVMISRPKRQSKTATPPTNRRIKSQ